MITLKDYSVGLIKHIFESSEEVANEKYNTIRSILNKYDIDLYDFLFPKPDQKISIYSVKYPLSEKDLNNGNIFHRGKPGERKICNRNADGLKTYLNIIGERGTTFDIKTGGTIYKKWNKGKPNYDKEYMRGEFGHISTFADNIEKILHNDIVGLYDAVIDKEDVGIHRNESSRSYDSVKVTWRDQEFYVCNTDSKKGQRVLIKTEYVQPKALNITSDVDNAFNISKPDFEEKIKKTLKIGLKEKLVIEDGKYADLLSFISNEIINSKSSYLLDKDKLSNLTKEKFEIKHVINLTDQYSAIYEQLPTIDLNSIEVGFGEVLTGLLLYKYCKPSDRVSLYWPDNGSEFLNDLYFNGIGFSIKSKDSNNGHKPSAAHALKNICQKIDGQKENNGTSEMLQQIYDISELYGISNKEIDEFLDQMHLFYKLTKNKTVSKQNQNRTIWKLSWSLFKNDINFKKLVRILKLNKDEYPNIEDALYIIDNYKDKEKINEILIGIADRSIKGNMDWQTVSWEGLKSSADITETDYYTSGGYKQTNLFKENYSKIMFPLLIRCITELNKLYTIEKSNNEDTINLFSIVLNNYLTTNQVDVNIKFNKHKNDLTIILSLYPLNKQIFEFVNAGAGPADWNGHGTIGFAPKKNKNK